MEAQRNGAVVDMPFRVGRELPKQQGALQRSGNAMNAHATPLNPFLLMTHPEVVFAAIANSVCLSQLDRHLCRPLDRGEEAPADDTSSTAAQAVDGSAATNVA